MAGKINGRAPFDFQKSTTERTIVAMLLIPRLPTPMPTRAPGCRRPPKGERASSSATAERTSSMLRSGNFWRTNRRPGNSMQGIISSEVWLRPEACSRWTRQLLFPLFFQHAEVFARRVQLKAEIRRADFGKCQEGLLAKREG